MSKAKANKTYVVKRDIWKKIRKLDHAKFDEWIKEFVKNIDEDNNKVHSKIFDEFSGINNIAILQALENTKGIGEKIKNSFIKNYNNAVNEKIKNNSLLISEDIIIWLNIDK